jgi:hypothetical protein
MFWAGPARNVYDTRKLMLIVSAIAVVEGTLSLLIAAIGILAALVVAAFVAGALSGVFITYYTLVRDDS